MLNKVMDDKYSTFFTIVFFQEIFHLGVDSDID